MNVKMWSVVAILILVLSGTGLYLSENLREKDRVAIVAMVNEEGSGVFASNSVPGLSLDPEPDEIAKWGGLTIATPGSSSIQHMIFMDFVKNRLNLKFELLGDGEKQKDTVYWTQVAPAQMGDTMLDGRIDGGITWEAHYSNVCKQSTKYNAYSVGLTTTLWEEHPCCVIAASREFIGSDPNAILRFLSAYYKSVEWVNEAIYEQSENHSKLIEYVKKNSGVENELVVQSALENVRYTYSLDNLKEGIGRMVDTYYSLGLLKNTIEEMGFQSPSEFADWLIDDSYINNAAGREPTSYTDLSENIHIDVAVLAYDIHQIALHAGIGEKIFDQYGISLNLGTPFAAGGDVMNAILSGQTQMGFVGSPPVVLNTINFW